MEFLILTLIAIICVLLIVVAYLNKERDEPTKYILRDRLFGNVHYLRSNGTIRYTDKKKRWNYKDAKRIKELYPRLSMIDCETGKEVHM